MEFEEARKELQDELAMGASISELQKKLMKGNIQAKVSAQLKTKKYFTVEKIQRKKRDIMQLLNKYSPESPEENVLSAPKTLTAMEAFSKVIQMQDGSSLLNKKHFKLGDKDLLVISLFLSMKTLAFHYLLFFTTILLTVTAICLLKVLVTNSLGKMKVYLATDQKGPLILHWALSRRRGEWMVSFEA